MTFFNSYGAADEFFAKARNKEAGRPIGPSGWRLYKDGDVFRITLHAYDIARIMPNDTLVMVAETVQHGFVSVLPNILPILIQRRGKNHYRLHIRKQGGKPHDLKAYGVNDWAELHTKGLRLYEGLTIDLKKREPVDYVEPLAVVDTDKRKVWLAQSRKVKRTLKTVAKLGGFQPRVDALQENRWVYQSLTAGAPSDIKIIVDAMMNDNIEPLIQRMAETFKKHSYYELNTEEMGKIIDNVFATNSLELRKALGVFEIKQ